MEKMDVIRMEKKEANIVHQKKMKSQQPLKCSQKIYHKMKLHTFLLYLNKTPQSWQPQQHHLQKISFLQPQRIEKLGDAMVEAVAEMEENEGAMGMVDVEEIMADVEEIMAGVDEMGDI